MKDKRWDIDLRFGLEGENEIRELLKLKGLEVKKDRIWHRTGNLFVEVMCWSQTLQDWENSGLNVTEASHWVFNLDGIAIFVEVDLLKQTVTKCGIRTLCKIEGNPSRGYLITMNDIQKIKHESVMLLNADTQEQKGA